MSPDGAAEDLLDLVSKSIITTFLERLIRSVRPCLDDINHCLRSHISLQDKQPMPAVFGFEHSESKSSACT
jgi:hypothetical protein